MSMRYSLIRPNTRLFYTFTTLKILVCFLKPLQRERVMRCGLIFALWLETLIPKLSFYCSLLFCFYKLNNLILKFFLSLPLLHSHYSISYNKVDSNSISWQAKSLVYPLFLFYLFNFSLRILFLIKDIIPYYNGIILKWTISKRVINRL